MPEPGSPSSGTPASGPAGAAPPGSGGHPSGDRPVYTLPPPRRRTHPLAWLLTIIVLAAIGYGAWRGAEWTRGALTARSSQQETIERLTRELGELRARADDLAKIQTELSQAVRKGSADVATLGARLDDSEQAVARLSEAIEGGRTRVQLAAVEQLLLMANDRLVLAHDAASALKALELADQRLAQLSDPRLFRVREALAAERSAVAKLALPDAAGVALSLAEILRQVPDLPLRTRIPQRFEATGAQPPPPPETSVMGRIWTAIKTALANVFALRRNDGPTPRLLSPDEQVLVEQILQLKLEGARLALLAGDASTFRELTAAARSWLVAHYDEAMPAVRVARDELERLQRLELAPALPDISRSLTLLRSHLGAGSR